MAKTFRNIRADGITDITGDMTASGSGSVPSTLATVNASPGTYTNATVTVNNKGLVTSVTNGSSGSGTILVFTSGPGSSGVAGTPLYDVSFTVTGLLATDTILSVTQKTTGASGTLALLGWINQVDNGLTGKYVADPGTGSIVLVAVKR